MMASNVDFPEPDGPVIATDWPALMLNVTLSNAWVLGGNHWLMPVMAMSGAACRGARVAANIVSCTGVCADIHDAVVCVHAAPSCFGSVTTVPALAFDAFDVNEHLPA